MMALDVVTNKLVGASYEPWYNLKGKEMINFMRKKRKGFREFMRSIRE